MINALLLASGRTDYHSPSSLVVEYNGGRVGGGEIIDGASFLFFNWHPVAGVCALSVPPSVDLLPNVSEMEADVGGDVKVTCVARGQPLPRVSWMRLAGVSISASGASFQCVTNPLLYLHIFASRFVFYCETGTLQTKPFTRKYLIRVPNKALYVAAIYCSSLATYSMETKLCKMHNSVPVLNFYLNSI